MAITAVSAFAPVSDNDGIDAAVGLTSPAFDVEAGDELLIHSRIESVGGNAGMAISDTLGGLTWTVQVAVAVSIGATSGRYNVWTATVPGNDNGTITVLPTDDSHLGALQGVLIRADSNSLSHAVEVTGNAAGGPTSDTLTLPSAPLSADMVVSVHTKANDSAYTVGSGYTQRDSTLISSPVPMSQQTQIRTGSTSTAAGRSWATGAGYDSYATIYHEEAGGGGGGLEIPIAMHHYTQNSR